MQDKPVTLAAVAGPQPEEQQEFPAKPAVIARQARKRGAEKPQHKRPHQAFDHQSRVRLKRIEVDPLRVIQRPQQHPAHPREHPQRKKDPIRFLQNHAPPTCHCPHRLATRPA